MSPNSRCIELEAYRNIFLHKRAEDRVVQQGFVTWELKKALVTTHKVPYRNIG
jgi:hypothetical protein